MASLYGYKTCQITYIARIALLSSKIFVVLVGAAACFLAATRGHGARMTHQTLQRVEFAAVTTVSVQGNVRMVTARIRNGGISVSRRPWWLFVMIHFNWV